MTDCLFCKIRDGEIPTEVIYKDDDCLAFRDINPKAPIHFLVIPRCITCTIMSSVVARLLALNNNA